MQRRSFVGRILASLAALICAPFVARQSGGGVGHIDLRPVYRWDGTAWQRLRMPNLKVGDLFRLGDLPGQFRVSGAPEVTQVTPAGDIWGVECYQVSPLEEKEVRHG